MSYIAPVKDMLFDIEHLARIEEIAKLPGFEDAGLDTVDAELIDDTEADDTDATDEPTSEFRGDEALDDELLDDDAETIDGKITIEVVESDEKASR